MRPCTVATGLRTTNLLLLLLHLLLRLLHLHLLLLLTVFRIVSLYNPVRQSKTKLFSPNPFQSVQNQLIQPYFKWGRESSK
jgi:hypothetical protein